MKDKSQPWVGTTAKNNGKINSLDKPVRLAFIRFGVDDASATHKTLSLVSCCRLLFQGVIYRSHRYRYLSIVTNTHCPPCRCKVSIIRLCELSLRSINEW